MSKRLERVRIELVKRIESLGSKKIWKHITDQIGMFAYSGLNEEEVTALRALHIYMNKDGRMSLAGINSSNIEYLAKAISEITS